MKILFVPACLLLTTIVQAQLFKVSSGTNFTIVSGTVFKADNLILTPSANFTITDNELTKSTTVNHFTVNPYISRVYQFANNTDPFSGSLRINYTDGAELNGIPESSLTLNVHDGTSWTAYPVATRDATNNFVLTTGLSAVTFNEFTLADLLTPLPIVWQSFKATKQNQTVLLQWATAQEQNTRNFTILHSSNGINWTGIGTLPAAGNSNSISNYSYVHTNPVTGINYYRILQTDIDSRNSYSDIKTVRFTTLDDLFTIQANPVTNNVLTLQVHTATSLALYSAEGKLLWQEQVNPGTKYIDVSRYAKSMYFIKTNSTVQKVLVQ